MISSTPYHCIVNSAAGGGRCRQLVEGALHDLRRAGVAIGDVEFTTHPGHATELARLATEAGAGQLLAVGGDGTGFEVINGMMAADTESRPTLGLLPLGTGNSFVRDFGIADTASAIARLTAAQSRPVDLVRVDHREGALVYMNLLTIGFISDAGDFANRRLKTLGDRGYLLAALACMARLQFPAEAIRLDGGEVERTPSSFLCFSNSQFTGGTVHIAPAADPTDGQLDVIRAGKMGKLRFARNLFRAYEGTHIQDPAVQQRRARVVEFLEPREHVVMLDGEIARLTLEKLTVLPGAIEVVL